MNGPSPGAGEQSFAGLPWTTFVAEVSSYLQIPIGELPPELDIYRQLGLDSLGLFSLGMHLNQHFGIELPLAAVASIETLRDIHVLVAERVAARLGTAVSSDPPEGQAR